MINVGMIGCGSITKIRHAPEYSTNPNVKIAGFFDPITDRAAEMANLYNANIYADYKDMLADSSIDAVSVCTSNKFHAAITVEALKAGKHVLCEKPMATSADECEQMVKAAKETGKILMIGHNQRFVDAHKKAKAILKSGEMGRILSFRTSFGHAGPEMWSADKSSNTWFFRKADAFAGTMGDLGIHKADLIRWLIDDEIVEVKAYTSVLDKKDHTGAPIEVDDNAVCLLKSKSGIVGSLTASWTYYGEEDNSTVIYCSEGMMKLCFDPEYPLVVIKRNGEKILYKVGNIQTNANQTKSGIIDSFVKSIVDNTAPEISGEDGMAALKIILACMESQEKGIAVEIK